LEATLRIIGQTIRDGPVQFSGGALATGTVFEFDQTQGQVLMAADLWRELSLLGHWIVDAVVLRWAQLTERFGHQQGIRSGEVLPLLLARAEPQRATGLARQVFLRHGIQHCTWSGRKLTAEFAVDHVIPFSLWGSNDLWNLLPVDARINAHKSDRLPAAGLLQDCRPRIVHGWQLLRDEAPQAFDRQAAHQLGRRISGTIAWEDDLFVRLREAVEVTALQRGVERWTPLARVPRQGAAA
jgi:hypothetical protein